MKTLAVISCFRNSARNGQVGAFMARMAALQTHLRRLMFNTGHDWSVRLIAVHGDSVDGTESALITAAGVHGIALQLIRVDHGGPVFGSTEEPARMKALSTLVNRGLDAVRVDDHYVFWVESDLRWEPSVVLDLLDELRVREFTDDRKQQPGVLAPLVFAGDAFYDIWGFRKGGERFGPFHPYHRDVRFDDVTTGLDSVGSALVMHGAVARTCRVKNELALVGFCEDVRANGWGIACDARKKVVHP